MPQQSVDQQSDVPRESPTLPGGGWSPCTVVIPTAEGQPILRSPFGRSVVRVGRRVMAAMASDVASAQVVLADYGLVGETHDESIARDVEHWFKRGWAHAVDTYLWSRRAAYHDDGDEYRERQGEALDAYMLDDGPPPRPRQLVDPLPLPGVSPLAGLAAGEVLRRRVTSRSFRRREVSMQTLADLLGHGLAGSTRYRDPEVHSRDRYLFSFGVAFDYYVAAFAVKGLESAVYLYDPNAHALGRVGTVHGESSTRDAFTELLIGQHQLKDAAVTVLVVADFPRYQWRYRHERALRNLYFDSGRMAQDLILVATALGMQNWLSPAVRDRLAEDLLGLEPIDQQILASVSVS